MCCNFTCVRTWTPSQVKVSVRNVHWQHMYHKTSMHSKEKSLVTIYTNIGSSDTGRRYASILFRTARNVGWPGLSYVRSVGGRMVRVGQAVGMSSSSSEMETNSSLEGPCELPVITDGCDEPSVTAASCGVFGTNSFGVGPSLGSLLVASNWCPQHTSSVSDESLHNSFFKCCVALRLGLGFGCCFATTGTCKLLNGSNRLRWSRRSRPPFSSALTS